VVNNCKDVGGGPRNLDVGKLEVLFSIVTGKLTMIFNTIAGL
jgi:hypothetical protein